MIKNIKDRLNVIEQSILAKKGITSIFILEYLNEHKYEIQFLGDTNKDILTYTDLDTFYKDYKVNPKDKNTYILKLPVAPNREVDYDIN